MILFALLFSCVAGWPVATAKAKEENFAGKVVQIDIGKDDLANSQSYAFMRRVISKAEEEKAVALVLNLHTPGGLAFETGELMVADLLPLSIPTYAYVNTQAMSAGALITAACKKIYVAPVSVIGAAALVSSTGEEIEQTMRKKLESYFSGTMRSVVTKNGHNPDVYKAMMMPADEDRVFGTVTLKKGDLLTLTGEEAVQMVDGKPLLAVGIATSVEELLKQENIAEPLVKATPTGFETIAWWLAWASPVLILLGIGGIYLEFKTPGFGVGGVVAIVAFALFFFGNNIAGNLAGYEMIGLFIVGVILICVEIFILPGFIVFGAIGVICIISALFGGMIDVISLEKLFSEGGFTVDNFMEMSSRPLLNLALGLIGGVILVGVMMKYLPELAIFRGFVNSDTSGGDNETEPVVQKPRLKAGDRGITVTELRPGGEARFGDYQYQVVSRGGLLLKGIKVRVVRMDSFNAIVEEDNGESTKIATNSDNDEIAK